jgi:type IX secretion system PorP/SprF family membrane protein
MILGTETVLKTIDVKKLLFIASLMFCSGNVWAQDVPLFTQKLSNSFLYNPSVAGNTFGSATLSYRKLWSAVEDAPTTSFGSIHTPFGQHRFGVGMNFYQDRISYNNNTFASAAFAYHIRINDYRTFSLGVSAEYNNQRLDYKGIDVIHPDDPRLTGNVPANHADFSFGASYRSRWFVLGGSANRLSTWSGVTSESSSFPAFYTGSLQFMLPLAGDRHLLEPMANYRSYVNGKGQIDAGMFYTFNEMATLGGSYRSGGTVNVTAALKLNKRVLIGYSRDIVTGDFSKGVGASNEITLRLDFRDESYYRNPKHARAINTSSINYRHKTMGPVKTTGHSMKDSKRYKHKIKRNSFRSPNYRINSSKKLMTVRKKHKVAKHRRRR